MKKSIEIIKGYEDEIPTNPETEPMIAADITPRPTRRNK